MIESRNFLIRIDNFGKARNTVGFVRGSCSSAKLFKIVLKSNFLNNNLYEKPCHEILEYPILRTRSFNSSWKNK